MPEATSKPYLTAPDPKQTKFPGGVPFIIGNEAAERFSFYGMKGILTIFMTQHLLNSAGEPAYMTDERAKTVYHLFTASAYFFPLVGAIISDVLWGKYKTILFISLMYCLGHGMLALMDLGPHMGWWDMKPFLFAGLILIAIGAGGIKPCVSAHVGDQFGSGNKHLLTQIFNWFYFSINLGAAASTLLTPVLLAKYGPWAAFGLPGVLMAIATFVFWLGRHRFVHVPAAGWAKWKAETFSPEGRRALINLSPLFLIFVPMFWMIFDQTGSAWVLQGDKMNRELGIVWLPSQIQAVNPIMILTGIPIFTYIVYPLMGKVFKVTPLRKIGIGLVLTALAFCLSAVIEQNIEDKQGPVAATMYVDLATDAAAQADIQDDASAAAKETDEERSMRWSRAAISAARVSEWKEHQIADFFGLEPDAEKMSEAKPDATAEEAETLIHSALGAALTKRMESKEGFDAAQVSAMFKILGTGTAEAHKPGTLNGAVIGARNAKWDETRVVGYLRVMPNILWQFLAYLILTAGEILVSIVCLEFAYTQSPKKMKSFIMGIYFLGVSLGNIYVSLVNEAIGLVEKDGEGSLLDGAMYYWFFAAIMGVTILVYLVWSKTYKGETFMQGDEDAAIESETEAIGPDTH